MKGKIIILLCCCLVSCSNKDKSEENKQIQKNVIEIDTKKQKEDKCILDEGGVTDLIFENLYFDNKDTEQVIDFFKDYDIYFEKSDSYIENVVADSNNKFHDGEDYGYDWVPKTPYLGNYVFDDRLNLLTTSLEDGKSDLEVYTKDLDKDAKVYTLIENINYLEPLYTYVDDKLYYSSDTVDGKSILGVFSLDDFGNKYLVENSLELNGEECTGDVISLVTKLDEKIVYQVSHYDGQSIREDKPLKNKLVYLDNPNRQVDLGENNFDFFEKSGDYFISHDRGYGEEDRYVKIYDKNYKLLYKITVPIDRLVNITNLEKNGKTYILLSDTMRTHYLVDVEENKKSYQLNGINSIDKDFWYNKDKFILSSGGESYIGRVKK